MKRRSVLRPHDLLFFVLLVSLIFAASAATAVRITVGIDGGAPADPLAYKRLDPTGVRPDCPLPEPTSIEVYLALDGAEEASYFQADFLLSLAGGWEVNSFDPISGANDSEVNPGKPPYGVGTWGDGAFGSITPTSAAVSLQSGNLGGERLVAKWVVSCTTCGPGDLFDVLLTNDPARLLAGYDIPGAVAEHDMAPFLGLHLARVEVVPEPGTALLFGAGLIGMGALRRRFSA